MVIVNKSTSTQFEQLGLAVLRFVNKRIRQAPADSVHNAPTVNFVPRRKPLSDEAMREIERLELAIRQGSVNA